MTESFLKRTLWSGSSSTGTEVGRVVCCATSMAGRTKSETRPSFMLETPGTRSMRKNRQYRTPVFCTGLTPGLRNGLNATLRALVMSPEHTIEERFLVPLGMTAKLIAASNGSAGDTTESRGPAEKLGEQFLEAGCAGGGGAHFGGVDAEAE